MPRDVVVVGSGPNGLAAAIVLADAGFGVTVLEQHETPGGGARSAALTIPGFLHDVCSTVHPLAAGSPFFRTLSLERHGLAWVQPACPLAHVMRDGAAVTLERDLDAACAALGEDARAWKSLVATEVERFDDLMPMILGPLRLPRHPLLFARFGLSALRSARALSQRLHAARSRALLAGIAAHAMQPLDRIATASFALVLASAAHAVGWPLARWGSQSITDALVARLRELGGEIELGRPVGTMEDLPAARAYVFDLTPRQLVRIAGDRLGSGYVRRLGRFRYGPGACKVDWALRGPIPWKDAACARAATVHLGGTFEDVARAEAEVHAGRVPLRPFVILVQPTLFDPSRAPDGLHVAWAYCHVPNGCPDDVSPAIEAEIESVAPGFQDLVVARSVLRANDLERYNPNYVGGDINGGAADLAQIFLRPVARLDPYSTPNPRIFLCSSSTPPGGGVHGMCGYWAAQSVLRRALR